MRAERPEGKIGLVDKSPIGETDPIIVSAPCSEIYRRYYMGAETPAEGRSPLEGLVSHILILDVPS